MTTAVDFAFMHGGGQGSWVWDETIAALRAQAGEGRVRCYALDAAGCGTKRGRDTSAMEFDAIARELVADIEAAGMRDVILIGHSQAGMVLPRMAEIAPGLFRRLVYVTCSAPLPGLTTLEQMGNGLQGENPDQVGWPVDPKTHSMEQRYRVMFCNDMAETEAQAFLAKLGQDMWPASSYTYSGWRYEHLASIPSSYVLCVKDKSLPPEWQERFAERLKVQRIVRIDAGHQVMNTRPQALAEVLLREAAR